MRFRSLSAAAALVLALTVVGVAAARPSVTHVATVKVTAKDYSFVLSPKTVKHGRVTFVIRNAGHAPHDFAIAGHHSKTIGPGATRVARMGIVNVPPRSSGPQPRDVVPAGSPCGN